ncbi:hypothetical protein QJS66_07030 [Kocuria rhizophila]|nr:hypothetical protein QJS66_07030 [Kocuria rhizophila]
MESHGPGGAGHRPRGRHLLACTTLKTPWPPTPAAGPAGRARPRGRVIVHARLGRASRTPRTGADAALRRLEATPAWVPRMDGTRGTCRARRDQPLVRLRDVPRCRPPGWPGGRLTGYRASLVGAGRPAGDRRARGHHTS